MKVIYLHIGLPKTGSSAIQEFLRLNAETLKGLGYYVPLYGRSHISHFSLISTLSGLPAPSSRHSDASAIRRDFEQWPDAIVLSSEKLFALLHHKHKPVPLLQFWRAIGAHVVVVLYVRNQTQFLNSAYTQNVKNFRFAGPFSDYLDQRMDRLAFNPYRYLQAARRHGVELRMRPYSPEVRRNNVVADFLRTIGISRELPLSLSRVNESPGPFRIEAARRLLSGIPVAQRRLTAQHARQATKLLKSMTDALKVDDGFYCGLTSEQARTLDAVFADDNEKLAREIWGVSWRDVFAEDLTQAFVPNDYQITGIPADKVDALKTVVAELAPAMAALANSDGPTSPAADKRWAWPRGLPWRQNG